jgi:hypothetical protein
MAYLNRSSLKPAAEVRNGHAVTLEAGVTFEDVCNRDFWKAAAPLLHRGDRIEVSAHGFAFTADLVVADVGQTWARVLVHKYTPHPVEEDNSDAWRAAFNVLPRAKGFTVFRLSDDSEHGAFPTLEAAEAAALRLHRR